MASTTKTENYQLNQYSANDQPTWVGDYSGDMLKIDTALGNAAKRTSDKFTEKEAYTIGRLCIQNDMLYKFTEAKEAGAWDETKVKATTIAEEFEQLNGDINQLTDNLSKIQFGDIYLNDDGSGHVSFGKTFSNIPKVFCQIRGSHVTTLLSVKTSNISKTGFDIVCSYSVDGSASISRPPYGFYVDWLAIEE